MVVLPFKEITVVFDGSSAVVDKLTGTSFWWLQVRAVNTAGASEWSQVVQILPTKESDWEEDTNNQATGAPTIDGTAQVDQTLTAVTTAIADLDGLDNVSYSYQWIRVDGTTDTDIENATASTYTLVSADVGKPIKATVSFTDDAGNEEDADQRGDGGGGGQAEHSCNGSACHQRRGAGGRDADGGHVGH